MPLAFEGRFGNPFSSLLGPCGHLKLIICMFGNVFFIDVASLLGPSGHLKLIMWGLFNPGMPLYRFWIAFGTLRGRKSRDFHDTVAMSKFYGCWMQERRRQLTALSGSGRASRALALVRQEMENRQAKATFPFSYSTSNPKHVFH